MECDEHSANPHWAQSKPKLRLQHRGFGPVTLSKRQRLFSHHQLNIKRNQQSGFRAYLPSSGLYTNKYLTNDDHIRRLYNKCDALVWTVSNGDRQSVDCVQWGSAECSSHATCFDFPADHIMLILVEWFTLAGTIVWWQTDGCSVRIFRFFRLRHNPRQCSTKQSGGASDV